MDEVLVKLADGTFVHKPMSDVLDIAPASAVSKTVFQPPPPFRDSGITAIADRIVEQCQIGADDVGSRRLRTFVLQYLEGRAKPHELQEFFVRSEKIGGLGLSDEAAKTCSAVIEGERERGSFRIGNTARPVQSELKSVVPPIPKPTPALVPRPMTLVEPLRVIPPSTGEPRPQSGNPMKESRPPGPVKSIGVFPLPPVPLPARRPQESKPEPSTTRPSVVDVRPPASSKLEQSQNEIPPPLKNSWWADATPPPLGGPAEEFLMSIEDFRRLSDDPNERIAMLKEKMDRLAKEGYSFKAAAVERWRKSAVFGLYLASAEESLKRALSVSDALAACAREGVSTLTIDEFNAIGQFNRWVGI